MKIRISPKDVTRVLFFVLATLLILHLAGLAFRGVFGKDAVEGYVRIVNFPDERNIPTLFTVVLILLNAAGSLFIGFYTRNRGAILAGFWIALGAVFAFLALDEFASLHEAISNKLENTYAFTGFLHWAWVIPYSFFVVIFFGVFSWFLWKIPRSTAIRFVIAGAVYVTGALALEMVESAVWSAEHHSLTVPIMLTLVTIEETLEMTGQILFFRAVMLHIRDHLANSIMIEM